MRHYIRSRPDAKPIGNYIVPGKKYAVTRWEQPSNMFCKFIDEVGDELMTSLKDSAWLSGGDWILGVYNDWTEVPEEEWPEHLRYAKERGFNVSRHVMPNPWEKLDVTEGQGEPARLYLEAIQRAALPGGPEGPAVLDAGGVQPGEPDDVRPGGACTEVADGEPHRGDPGGCDGGEPPCYLEAPGPVAEKGEEPDKDGEGLEAEAAEDPLGGGYAPGCG